MAPFISSQCPSFIGIVLLHKKPDTVHVASDVYYHKMCLQKKNNDHRSEYRLAVAKMYENVFPRFTESL